jgi:hypothetical protein
MRLPSGSFSYEIMVMEIVVSSLPKGAVVPSDFIAILSLDRRVLWDRGVRRHTPNEYTTNLFPSLNTKRASLTLYEQIEASQVEQAVTQS